MKDLVFLVVFVVLFVSGFTYIARQSVGLQQNIQKIILNKWGRVSYYCRPYRDTGKWAIYYFGPEGHVYLDPRFDTEEQAKMYIESTLLKKWIDTEFVPETNMKYENDDVNGSQSQR